MRVSQMWNSVAVTMACILMHTVQSTSALAASCADVDFEESYSSAQGDLTLNGMGIRKATFLKVKVYVVALYLPDKSSNPENILRADQAWRLDLQFVRDVEASDMQEAFQEGFESTGEDLEPLKPRIEKQIAMLSDFSEGDSLTFTYLPDSGTSTGLNNTEKGVVEGADFAKTLLAIWLGPKPANEDMKKGILGGECG